MSSSDLFIIFGPLTVLAIGMAVVLIVLEMRGYNE